MPVHEYVCRDCKKVFNISGTFALFINLIPVCPDCGSINITKKIFAPTILFNGDGFYANDKEKSV